MTMGEQEQLAAGLRDIAATVPDAPIDPESIRRSHTPGRDRRARLAVVGAAAVGFGLIGTGLAYGSRGTGDLATTSGAPGAFGTPAPAEAGLPSCLEVPPSPYAASKDPSGTFVTPKPAPEGVEVPARPAPEKTVPEDLAAKKQAAAAATSEPPQSSQRFKATGVITAIDGTTITLMAQQPFTGALTLRLTAQTRFERAGLPCQAQLEVGERIGVAAVRSGGPDDATIEAVALD